MIKHLSITNTVPALFFGASSAFLVSLQNQSSFWQVRKPKVTTASLQPKSTDGMKMHSRVLNVKASNGKRWREEKKWKIQTTGRDRWRRPSLSKREKLKALSNQMSGLSQEVLLSRKKPVVTRRQKKHHCVKNLKRKHCHEPFQFIFPHWTLTSVVSDIPSICKCSSVGRGAMRRQKLWIIDAMHSLLTVTSALRVKIRPIHGSS